MPETGSQALIQMPFHVPATAARCDEPAGRAWVWTVCTEVVISFPAPSLSYFLDQEMLI